MDVFPTRMQPPRTALSAVLAVLALVACTSGPPQVEPRADAVRASIAGTGAACRSGEAVVFACTLESTGHRIAICMDTASASHRSYFVREQNGARTVVANPADGPGAFTHSLVRYSRDFGGSAYSFEHDGQTRVLYWLRAANGHTEQGTLLMPPEPGASRRAHEKCAPGTLVGEEHDASTTRILAGWPSNPLIVANGIP